MLYYTRCSIGGDIRKRCMITAGCQNLWPCEKHSTLDFGYLKHMLVIIFDVHERDAADTIYSIKSGNRSIRCS